MSAPVVNERIAARRAEVRARRRRVRLRRTGIVVTVLLAAVVAVAVERSSLVALASVAVEGNDRLAREDVVALTGLELGTSVLRLPLGEAEAALEAHPVVADATISRDGVLGVTVTVREAVPVLVAVAPDGSSVLVAADGTVVAAGDAPGATVVSLPDAPPPVGADVGEQPELATAHEVVTRLPGPLAGLVARVEVPEADELDLLLEDGTRVRWGDEDRGAEKARALGAVLEDLGERTVRTIDVRAPAAPTTSG